MNQHRSAIVTGAGSGIGRAVAIRLAEAGFQLLAVGRTESKLKETARLCPGAATMIAPIDLTEAGAAARVVDEALAAFGRIDALTHIAGDAPLMPIRDFTPEIVRRCVMTNLAAAADLAAAAWPAFEKQHAGAIVNVSSMASFDPFPGFSIYAAAKVGVNMFTRCLAQEAEQIGVRAVAVAPGAVETPMLRSIFGEDQLPREKTLAPEDVASVICDCATGAREFQPGETIQVPSP